MSQVDCGLLENYFLVRESHYTLFLSDGRTWIWRIQGERVLPEYIVPTIKFGGSGVRVVGDFRGMA